MLFPVITERLNPTTERLNIPLVGYSGDSLTPYQVDIDGIHVIICHLYPLVNGLCTVLLRLVHDVDAVFFILMLFIVKF